MTDYLRGAAHWFGALRPASRDEQYVAKSGGRACRLDGSPYTKPPHASRRSKRRDASARAKEQRARRNRQQRKARSKRPRKTPPQKET